MNNVAQPNSELSRIRFLDYELDLSQTFLDIAGGESDDPFTAIAARTKTRLGHDVVLTWIDSIRVRGKGIAS